MDYIAGEKELDQEVKQQIKSMSNVRVLTEDEKRDGNNLKIALLGEDDTVTISNYFYDDWYKVEAFQTSDGSVLDYPKLNVMIHAMASFEDTTGMMWEDAVEQKNEQANDIINQWWTKEAI